MLGGWGSRLQAASLAPVGSSPGALPHPHGSQQGLQPVTPLSPRGQAAVITLAQARAVLPASQVPPQVPGWTAQSRLGAHHRPRHAAPHSRSHPPVRLLELSALMESLAPRQLPLPGTPAERGE